MIIIVHCFLGNGYCTFGFLIFIIDEGNFLYYSLYILTEKSLKHLCSIRAWVPVSFFLSLSLSLSLGLILWSAEACWAHFPAQAFQTFSRGCPMPSGAVQVLCKSFIGFPRNPKNIGLFLSLPLFSTLSFPWDRPTPGQRPFAIRPLYMKHSTPAGP